MTETDESVIDAIDVLLFDSGDDTFSYRGTGYEVTGAGASRSFKVKLPAGNYNAVVLANVSTLVSSKLAQLAGKTRAQALALLPVELAPGVKWTSTRLPMWGYKTGLAIGDATGTVSGIDMVRAVARVDVKLAAGINNFTLEEARLYNYSRAGTLAPLVSGDGYAAWSGTGVLPNLPPLASLSNTTDAVKQAEPLLYTATGNAVEREIYTFEAAAGSAGTTTNTCLVIGGRYDGSADVTYYRVEFITGSADNPAYLPLRRDHEYIVTITGVTGPGFPTPEIAYTAQPVNITTAISAWNNGNPADVTFSGQHQLTVDKGRLEYGREGAPVSLTVYTDVPGGWKIATKPTWITTTVTTGAAGATVTFNVSATELTASDREGTLTITAGNLTKVIQLFQSSLSLFRLEVSPSDLVFYKTPTAAQRVNVTCSPAGLACTVTVTGDVTPWTSVPTTGTIAGYYDIRPAANSSTNTRNASITITVTHSDGRQITRVITVTQLGREIFHANVVNPYAAAGGDFSFNVFSSVPWRLA
jgi:hypothetical protein